MPIGARGRSACRGSRARAATPAPDPGSARGAGMGGGAARASRAWRSGAVLGLCAALAQPVAAQHADLLEGAPLAEALRAGGYVLYFRHAATDWSGTDRVRAAGEWTSCDPARMRQLSPD